MSETQLKAIRLAALKYLTARALTSHELRKKLSGKGFEVEEIDVVIAEFANKRLIDDAGIADDVIEYSISRRLEGKRQARNRLIRRGVELESVTEKLDEIYTGESELSAAQAFADKKLRSLMNYTKDVQRRRIGSALDRRGFPSVIIQKVLSELSFSTDEVSQVEED